MVAAAILGFDFLYHISIANTDVCGKFGTEIDIGYTRVMDAQNPSFCKIQDGDDHLLDLDF